jgi:hypothetical protein
MVLAGSLVLSRLAPPRTTIKTMANLDEVKLFLDALRGEDVTIYGLDPNDCARPIITEVFTRGNCGNLAIMLSVAFGARPVLLADVCHVVSDIDGRLFDINGDVTDKYHTSAKRHLSLSDLMKEDVVNNYSFLERGPII